MSKRLRSGILAMVVAIFAFALVVAPKTALAADIDQVLYDDPDAGINVRFDASDGTSDNNVTVNVYVDGTLKSETELTGVRRNGARVYVEAEHYDVSASINNRGTAAWMPLGKYFNLNLDVLETDYVLDINIDKNGDIDQVLYADEESGINVHFEADEGAIKKNVNVSVYVEGELKKSTALKGVPQAGSHVNITADGYDCYPEIDGGGVATYIAGQSYVRVELGGSETYNLTISLAKDKIGGDNTIADETTEYGTFSWVNSTNVNCAFLRTVTVYVDDNPEPVATDTIVTPENLSNSEGSANHQYWFTPNTLLYKTSDVRIEPSTTLNSTTNRHISVYLTSLCGCGLDTCVCDGGCDCPVDCDCDYCTGAALGENQINTGYGILGYAPVGSEEDGSGYNLTVKLYVNGVLAWDELSDQPLRIKGAGDGDGDYLHNLEFEPASGYYYFAHEVNPYDLDTYGDAASTWDQSQGRLDFADTRDEMRNYHNVLNIYLWTFPNSVNLNVDRGISVGDEVWNYTISYTLPDPKTGENRTWTYNATSFNAAQAQIIPTNTPVTLTGVCEPGKEVEQWRCEDASNLVLGNGIDFTDPAGNEEANGRIVKNASAVLNVKNSYYTTVTVYIDRFAWAKAPTPEEIQGILGDSAVTVDCVSPYVSHESETYALADGTFTVGNPYEDGEGYYVDVTVTPDSYLDTYNEDKSEHTLADPEQDKVVTFSHDGTKWVAKDGESPLVLEVMCNDAPAGPTDEQIKELIGDVKVDCVNDEAFHVTGSYALQEGYELSEVSGDAQNGFTVTVNIPVDAYVDQYDAETNAEHELADASTSPAVVTLENTGDGWTVKSGKPVVFKVVCETLPDVPTFDQLEGIFADGLVTVDCINSEVDPAHADKIYGVLEGSYLFGDVTSNDDGTFSVVMDVYPARYAQQYSIDTQINHWLDPADQAAKQVTLTYANDAWTADDSAAITVSVKCANETEVPPVPPTGDELNNLEGADITVACVTDESHEEKPYDPIVGAYTFGEVAKNDEGVYEVVMTVTPSEYVKRYVADTQMNHWLDEGEDVPKTLTLQYKDDAWVVVSEGICYRVVCLPDPPTEEEVKTILGNAAVTVDCVSPYVSHESETYALEDGTFEVGSSYATDDGYFVDVTVTPDTYVDACGSDGSFHKLSDPGQDTVIVFRYVNGEWEPCYGESPLVLEVICSDAPEAPTDERIKSLIGDVKVDCTNTLVNHMMGTYELSDYTPGSVLASSEGGYTYTVTISAESYVKQYDESLPGHKLVDGATNPATVILENKGEGWKVQSGTPVVFEVICENQTPTPGGGTITVTPADMTIYEGGDEGYEGVVDASGNAAQNANSLPEPMYNITADNGTDPDGMVIESGNNSWVVEETDHDGLYRLEPKDNGPEVRVQYKDGDEVVTEDGFETSVAGDSYNTLSIAIFSDANETPTATASDGGTYDVTTETGELTVRSVDEPDKDATLADIANAAPDTKLNSGTAVAVEPEGTTYTVNNTDVVVENTEGASLLFDGIIDDEHNRTELLEDEIVKRGQADEGFESEIKYLDLVDAHDGNTWIKSSEGVDIYWAYPEGTGPSTDFKIVHFKGLHRDDTEGDSGFNPADITKADIEIVGLERMENGIKFHVTEGNFSPYALVWDYDNGSDTPIIVPGGDGDDERPTPDDTGVSDWLDTEDHRAYLSGYGDGSGLFGVDEPMTRAEAATMFHNLLLDKSMGEYDADFPDLREGAYYVDAVRTLASRGIIMGNGDGTFAPDRPVTRAEFVAIAMRFTDSDQSGANPFSDVEEGSWYYGPVVGSAKFGWVSGYVDGTFAPEDTLTRGQATAIVNHMLGRAADEAWAEAHMGQVKTFPDVYEGHFAYGEVLEATNSHDYEWEDGVESWTGLKK